MRRTSPAPSLERRRPRQRRNKEAAERGAYLIEILAVLALTGLAAMLAVPAIRRATSLTQLPVAAVDIASALVEARTQAIAGGRGSVAVVQAGSRLVTAAGRAIRLPPGLDFDVLAAGSCPSEGGTLGITFAPDGHSCGAVMRLSDGMRRLRIRIDWYSGHVQIQKG